MTLLEDLKRVCAPETFHPINNCLTQQLIRSKGLSTARPEAALRNVGYTPQEASAGASLYWETAIDMELFPPGAEGHAKAMDLAEKLISGEA